MPGDVAENVHHTGFGISLVTCRLNYHHSATAAGQHETWHLVINTGTTIISFLMVFLIQRAQNKDTVALYLKLNELIAANKHAATGLSILKI